MVTGSLNLCILGGASSTEVTPVSAQSKSLLNVSSRVSTPHSGSKTTPHSGSRTTPHGGSKTTTPHSGRRSMPVSELKATPENAEKASRLVDISGEDDDEEDEAVTQFGRLKVGFTPGMDGKSRRVRTVVLTRCS